MGKASKWLGVLALVLVALASSVKAAADPNSYRRGPEEEPEPCTVKITAPESSADSEDAPITASVECAGKTIYEKTTPISELQEVDLKGRFKLFSKSTGVGPAYLYVYNNREFDLRSCEIKNLRPLPGVDTIAPVVIDGSEGSIKYSIIQGNKGFKVSGAIYATASSYRRSRLYLEDSLIQENAAEECGGLTVDTYSKANSLRVDFIRNFGEEFAGAARVLESGKSDFDKCTFEGVPPPEEFVRFVNGHTNVLPNEPIPRAGAISVENFGRSDIDGCNITNHHGHFGTLFSNEQTSIYVTETIFSSNVVANGGGVYVDGDLMNSAKVLYSTFQGNSARWGGALMVLGRGEFLVHASDFQNNNALFGGVLFGDYEKLNSTGYSTCEYSSRGSRIAMEYSNFFANSAKESGGVVYSKCSAVTMDENKFQDNFSGKNGGALFLENVLALDTPNCEYVNNTAGLAGGAIFVNKISAQLIFESSNFLGNKAGPDGGGAIHAANAENTITFKNALLTENEAEGRGGAVALLQVANLEMHDCGMDGNRAGESGGAVSAEGLEKAIFRKANFSRNIGNHGGALSLTKSGGVALKEILLEHNTAAGAGGAMHVDGLKNLNISESVFQSNEAKSEGGGAIFASKTDSLRIAHDLIWSESKRRALLTIDRGSVFANNTAGGDGGAISIEDSPSALLSRVSIVGNKGKNGGGINVGNSGEISMEASSLRSNEAQNGTGGALAVFGATKVELRSMRIFENAASAQGGAIKADSVSHFDVSGTDIGSNNAKEGAGMDITGATNFTGSVVTFALNEADSSGGALTCSGNSKIDVSRSLFDFNYAPDAGSILTRCHCNVTATDCAFKRDKKRSNNGDFFESANKCSGVDTEHCSFWGGPWKLPLLWLIILVVTTAVAAGGGIAVCRAFILRKKGKREPEAEAEAEALLADGPTISYTASSEYSSYYDDDDDLDDDNNDASHRDTVVDIPQGDDKDAKIPPQHDQGNHQTAARPSHDATDLASSPGVPIVPIAIRIDPCSAPLSSSPSTLCSEPIHDDVGDVSDHSIEKVEGEFGEPRLGVEPVGGLPSSSGDVDEIVEGKEEGGSVLTAVVPVGEPAVDGDGGEGGPSASNGGARPSIPSIFGWENEVPKRKNSSDLESSLNTEDLASSFDSSDWTETSSERGGR